MKSQRALATVLSCALAIAILCQILFLRSWAYSTWGDRDVVRSLQIFSHFPFSGPEAGFSAGFRVPGGFLYYLMALPLFLYPSPDSAYLLQLLLSLGSVVLLFQLLKSDQGRVPALFGCAWYALSPLLMRQISALWNPGFLPLFLVLCWYLFRRASVENRSWLHFGALISAGLAAQIHLFGFILFASLGLARIWNERRSVGSVILQMGIALIVLYTPYVVSEVMNGGENSQLALQAGRPGEDSPRNCWVNFRRSLFHLGVGYTSRFRDNTGASYWKKFRDREGRLAWPFLVTAITPFLLLAIGLLTSFRTLLAGNGSISPAVKLSIVVLLMNLLAAVFSRSMLDDTPNSGRFLLISLPAVSFFIALAIKNLLALKGPGPYVVSLILGTCLLVQSVGPFFLFEPTQVRGFYGHQRFLDEIARHFGISPLELVQRFSQARRNERGEWALQRNYPIGFFLWRQGLQSVGSGGPPCRLLIWDGVDSVAGEMISTTFLENLFRQPLIDLKITSVERHKRNWLVTYSIGGRCPITSGNRYVFSDPEVISQSYFKKIPENSSITIAGDRSVFHFGPLIYGVAQLDRNRRELTLHSNQLRGATSNGGFYVEAMIYHPQLQWQDLATGRTVRKFIDTLPLGGFGVWSPIPFAYPDGILPNHRYRISLSGIPSPELILTPNSPNLPLVVPQQGPVSTVLFADVTL